VDRHYPSPGAALPATRGHGVRNIGGVERASGALRLARLHAGLAVACAICTAGFCVEVLRATGGNELSWAYVFEWPFLCAYAFYMWRRLVVDERRRAAGLAPSVRARREPRSARGRARALRREAEEAGALESWNRYLAEVNPVATDVRREPP
jgi:hypothetical protein